MHYSKFALAGLLFIGTIHAANASSVEAIALLNNYNLITSGNVQSYSEVDGNALIGGNLSGGSNYHIHNTSTAVPALTVAGDITGNANVNGPGLNVGGDISGYVTMNGGGNAYIGSVSGGLQNNANGTGSTYVVGDISGSVNTNGGSTVYGGNLTGYASANGGGSVSNQTVSTPFDPATQVADAISTLSQFSNQLAGLSANSGYSISGGKVTFNAIADSTGLAVFSIDDATNFFNNAYEFEFNMGSAESILFNVDSAADLNIHVNFLASAATIWGSNILWNFSNANSLNIMNQFGGSILALNAMVTTGQNIEGTLAAKSLIQYAEIHSQPLNFTPPSEVPVPAAAPLFLSGLLGFFGVARRNRKKAN